MTKQEIKNRILALRRMPYSRERYRIIQAYRKSLKILELTQTPSFSSGIERQPEKIFIENFD